MIEFYGEHSDEFKHYIGRRQAKMETITVSISVIIVTIAIILLGIFWQKYLLYFAVIPFVALPVFAYFAYKRPNIKTIALITPAKVSIEEHIIYSEGRIFNQSRDLSKVKKVVDFGEWYHVIFYFPHKSPYFICQKNLITKGTLEEFEKLFEDKLVKVCHGDVFNDIDD